MDFRDIDNRYFYSGGNWNKDMKDKMERFFEGLELTANSNGWPAEISIRSWKENEGVTHVDKCPEDMDFAVAKSQNVEYSISPVYGVLETCQGRSRHEIRFTKEGIKVYDKKLDMKVKFVIT